MNLTILHYRSIDSTQQRQADIRSRRWTVALSLLLALLVGLLFWQVDRVGGWLAIF